MEDETKWGVGKQRFYDDTDYSVDPNLKNIDPVSEEEPVKEVSLDDPLDNL